jgi:hypothetical protein
VFPEPVITQGANTANGVHARLDEKPDLSDLFPLELPVQGRKYATAQVGDATLTAKKSNCDRIGTMLRYVHFPFSFFIFRNAGYFPNE